MWLRGTKTIASCPGNCMVCQEVDKHKYYNFRWQKSKDRYAVCGMCREKLGFRVIRKACFYTRCEKGKEC